MRQKAIEELKEILIKTDTVYTVLRHVSRSGMKRSIDLYIIQDNTPFYITKLVAKALNKKQDKYGLVVTGVGMDVGFSIVYSLSKLSGCKLNHKIERRKK